MIRRCLLCAVVVVAAWCAGPVLAIHTLDRRMAARSPGR